MATIDLSLTIICEQRRQRRLRPRSNNNRFDMTNIYTIFPQISQMEFDMRRKSEILSYNPTARNTQTNSITQTGSFAQLMRGTKISKITSTQTIFLNQMDVCGNIVQLIVRYPDSYTSEIVPNGTTSTGEPLYLTIYTIIPNGRLLNFCNNEQIPQPTSSSNVPGKIIYLWKDMDVPLYNYKSSIGQYGITSPTIEKAWDAFADNNIICYNRIITKLFTLYINSPIDDYAINYNVFIPVYLFFSGEPIVTTASETKTLTNSISVDNISIAVTYNENAVELARITRISPTIQFPETIFTLDLLTDEIIPSFEGGMYLGMLNISDLYLYTQSGYTYDIKITVTLKFNGDIFYTSYYNQQPTMGVYCNTTLANKRSINCNILSEPSLSVNTGFRVTGS
jgi:hypothetical protein